MTIVADDMLPFLEIIYCFQQKAKRNGNTSMSAVYTEMNERMIWRKLWYYIVWSLEEYGIAFKGVMETRAISRCVYIYS